MEQRSRSTLESMEFLLSKLLPLALYPLGLALLLQILGLLGRRRRWATWLSGAGVALLWLAAMPLVSRQLVWGLEERASRLTPEPIPRADAVLVLGGGLRPAQAPRRSVEVGEAGDRLLMGVELLRRGRAPWLVVSGGRVAFTAPAGSTVLIENDVSIQALRHGRNWAFQCHPETPVFVAEALARALRGDFDGTVRPETSAFFERNGVDPDQLIADAHAADRSATAIAHGIGFGFAAVCRGER